MSTRILREQQSDFFLLNYLTMVATTADADANIHANNTSKFSAKPPQRTLNEARSINWHRLHASLPRLVTSILILLGFNVVTTQDAHPPWGRVHHGPSVYKPPWPPPMSMPWSLLETTSKPDIQVKEDLFPSFILPSATDESLRKQCSTEKFSQDLPDKFSQDLVNVGLRHLNCF